MWFDWGVLIHALQFICLFIYSICHVWGPTCCEISKRCTEFNFNSPQENKSELSVPCIIKKLLFAEALSPFIEINVQEAYVTKSIHYTAE